MNFPAETVVCDYCNVSHDVAAKKFWTKCLSADCGKTILRKLVPSYIYVAIKCKETKWDCVNENKKTIACNCCEQPVKFVIDTKTVHSVRNGQTVFPTEKLTGYISRRMEELQEEKDKLAVAEKKLAEMGKNMPSVKREKVDKLKNDKVPLLWKKITTNCDGCGKEETLKRHKYTGKCESKACKTRILCRPARPGMKYVVYNCGKCHKNYHTIVSSNALFKTSRCCNQEFAMDTIATKILNGQTFYSTVPSSPFIKCLVQELHDTRRNVEAANAKLEKAAKKTPFWKRFAEKTAKKLVEKEEKKPLLLLGSL